MGAVIAASRVAGTLRQWRVAGVAVVQALVGLVGIHISRPTRMLPVEAITMLLTLVPPRLRRSKVGTG